MKEKRICCTKKREVVISSFFCDSRGSIAYNQFTKKFSKKFNEKPNWQTPPRNFAVL